MSPKTPFFPPWFDNLAKLVGGLIVGGLLYVLTLVFLAVSPKTTYTGYKPEQPVPYSHMLHAGQLGIDCRYCHSTVERAAFAAVPPTQTCMGCHTGIRTTSDKLQPVRDSYNTGLPIQWVKVHDLPDFVYFNHSAHVQRGVGCVSCHGRIDRMDETGVQQEKLLTMGWCLDCHRNPEPHLREVSEVTIMDLKLTPEEQLERGREIRQRENINPPQDCSTCHR
jgi:hypothetical protein